MGNAIYFVAILPDEDIISEVTSFKEYAAKHFNSSHALRSPPHITLIPPFKWFTEKEESIDACLSQFVREQQSFDLKLKDFDSFIPRVIFVDVEESKALKNCQSELAEKFEKDLEIKKEVRYRFHPHMTVAFKDLKKKVFPEAWSYFSEKKYRRSFTVDGLYLLKHNQKKWEVIRKFSLEL